MLSNSFQVDEKNDWQSIGEKNDWQVLVCLSRVLAEEIKNPLTHTCIPVLIVVFHFDILHLKIHAFLLLPCSTCVHC